MRMIQKYWLAGLLLLSVNAYAQTPAENTPGNNAWNVYTYRSSSATLSYDQYVGYFPLNMLSFDVSSHVLAGNPANGPSVAPGYTSTSSTSVSTFDFSLKFIRTGWTCGTYRFTLSQWDDYARIYVDTDGNNTWDIITPLLTCCAGSSSIAYNFTLNPNSIVMVGYKEDSGDADLNVSISYTGGLPSYCFTAAVASTQNVSCPGGSDGSVTLTLDQGTPPFTVNGSSYNTRSITVSGLSANAYNWSVVDATAETRTVGFTIGTTPDNTAPVVRTRNHTAYLDANGQTSIIATNIDNGTTDNCSVATRTLSRTAFTCTDLGNQTVILTATDPSGNANQATATVTVADSTRPTVITRNHTAYLDFNGQASIGITDINNGTTDNCSVASLSLSQTAFNCTHLGNNTVTLTATDQSGNVNTGTATLTLLDTIHPTVVTQNITLVLDANGQASTTPQAIDNGTSDNCSIASLTLSQTAFDCSDRGNNTVTLTATDQSGNVSTGTAVVRVIDDSIPNLVVQPVTAYLDGTGAVSVTAADFDAGSNDNCTLISLAVSRTSFTCADTGSHTLILSGLDQSGNSATANVSLTVLDTVSPVALARDTVLYLDTNGQATVTAAGLDLGSTDNCGVLSIALSQTAYDCSHLGANTRTFTVTDVNGNATAVNVVVTVLDTILPVAVAQPDTLYLDANGAATLDLNRVDAGSSDNCSLAVRSLSRTAYDCAAVGVDTVVLTVVDIAGNSATDTVLIVIEDTIRPTVLVQNITVYLDSMGQAAFDTSHINAGTFDNCGLDTLYLSQYGVACAQLGVDSVYLYAIDANGNQDSAKAYVQVLDTIAPVLAFQSITVYLDSAGQVPITVAMVDTGTQDNCGLDTMYLSRQMLTCADVGTLRIAITAMDSSGNVSTDSLSVTVVDTIAPVVTTRTITKNLDPNGIATLTVAEIEVSSSDNCGIASKALSQYTVECSEIGFYPIILFVTDVHGNVASDTVLIAVEDVNDPIIVTRNATVELDSAGRAILNPNLLNNGSYDNCAVATFSVNRTQFTCADLGQNPVLATAIDEAGNTSSASVFVTVVDRIAPVVRTRNVSVQLDTNGIATIEAEDIEAGSTDNCGVVSIALDQTQFDCSHVGQPVTVTLTVTDASGNSATGTALVTVIDDVAPVFVCHPLEWSMDATGVLTITPEDMIDSIVELCDYSVTLSQTTFDVSHIGENPVQVIMTDAGGNVTTCETVVRVRFDCVPYNGIITPNNDGYNDSWEVECLAAVDNEVAIYNRFGQVVFFTDNYTGGWTGIATDGNPLPRGAYFYVIKIFVGGQERSIRGNITILRQ